MKFAFIVVAVLLISCRNSQHKTEPIPDPHAPPPSRWLAGVTIADEPTPYDSPGAVEVYDHLQTLGVNSVALTPLAFMPDIHKPKLRWSDHSNVRQGIELLHQRGISVLIKPYIWSHTFVADSGTWTGEIAMSSDSDWSAFFNNYRDFIINYARIAEETHTELFCIGLEYPKTFSHKSEWDSLIHAVRVVYHGPITYAATGVDEAEVVPFWDKLDVIGVDAFVPLTENKNPTKDELCASWQSYITRLEAIYHKYNKPIVFTEAGYKSCVGAACKPWEWVEHTPHPVDLQQQSVCYDALATSVFNKPWFAGIFWWKYYTTMDAGGRTDIDFTPMGKPAEKMMGKWFNSKRR